MLKFVSVLSLDVAYFHILVVVFPLGVLGVVAVAVLVRDYVLLDVIILNSSEGNKSVAFKLTATPSWLLVEILLFIRGSVGPVPVFLLGNVSFGLSLELGEVLEMGAQVLALLCLPEN